MADRPLRVPLKGLDPQASSWPLPPEAAHYVVDVRRLKSGDALVVFDASGLEAPATLASEEGGWIAVAAGPVVQGETGADLTLCYALPKGEKLDAVLRQVTELGVGAVLLVQSERAVSRLDASRAAKKRQRWDRLVQEAARQCGRADAPRLDGPVSFAEALEATADAQWRAILHPEAAAPWPIDGEAGPGALFVGPEGGFSPSELAQAAAAGVTPVGLGPLVLRTETAAVVGAALALDRMGALCGASEASR